MKKGGKKKQVQNNLPDGWFYMSEHELTVKDLSKAFDQSDYETEVWNEACVLEIIVGDKISVDVEQCEVDLGDDYSNDYLKKHKVSSLFYLSFKKDAYESCKPVLLMLVKKWGGMICGDTDDFTPVMK